MTAPLPGTQVNLLRGNTNQVHTNMFGGRLVRCDELDGKFKAWKEAQKKGPSFRFAQRSYNPVTAKQDYTQLRATLNRNAGFSGLNQYSVFNQMPQPQWGMGNAKPSAMDWATFVLSVGKLGLETANAFAKSNESGVSATGAGSANGTDGKGGADAPKFTPAKDLTGGLKQAKSLNAIQDLKRNSDTKKITLPAEYNAISDTIDSSINTDAIKDAIGKDVNLSAPTMSEIDTKDIPKSITLAKADKNKIGTFKTEGLAGVRADIETKSAEVTKTINECNSNITKLTVSISNVDANIAKLQALGSTDPKVTARITELNAEKTDLKKQKTEAETKLKEANGQKEKITVAQTNITQIEKACETAMKEVDAKIAELEDIEKFEAKVKDTEYDMAKTQEKELKQVMAKIEKFNKKYNSKTDNNKDIYNKSDERRTDKKAEIAAERQELYAQLGSLMTSLEALPNGETENSKGEKYSVAQTLSQAQALKGTFDVPEPVDDKKETEEPGGGGSL